MWEMKNLLMGDGVRLQLKRRGYLREVINAWTFFKDSSSLFIFYINNNFINRQHERVNEKIFKGIIHTEEDWYISQKVLDNL